MYRATQSDCTWQELNKKFQEKHTWLLDTDLNLSKIRNLKRETLVSCQRLNIEVATAALACVYFEKLVLSHVRRRLLIADRVPAAGD